MGAPRLAVNEKLVVQTGKDLRRSNLNAYRRENFRPLIRRKLRVIIKVLESSLLKFCYETTQPHNAILSNISRTNSQKMQKYCFIAAIPWFRVFLHFCIFDWNVAALWCCTIPYWTFGAPSSVGSRALHDIFLLLSGGDSLNGIHFTRSHIHPKLFSFRWSEGSMKARSFSKA